MVKAFDPDKTSKAELINKMFTLSTVVHCFVNDTSIWRLSACVRTCIHVWAHSMSVC